MAEEKNETLKKASGVMTYLTGEEEAKRIAELEEKWESDWNSSINSAKEEGIEEGIQKGIEKGKKESLKEVAKKMKKQGMQNELIAEITKLTLKEIEMLDL